MRFVKTDTILDKILARKLQDLTDMVSVPGWRERTMQAAAEAPPARPFAAALRRAHIALIAEVKRASPSKGILIEDFDPLALASAYADNGAAAISVLTDTPFFGGDLEHLRVVRAAVEVPVLRKDFILDPLQVYEGRAAGADAMLLIAAALDDAQLVDLHRLIVGLGMAALVEVHDEGELERVLRIGAHLIGVNNRDLRTFHEDLGVTERLARLLPADVTLVAESAIRSLEDVRRMGMAGAHAILVGEGLVRAGKLADQVRAFSSQPRTDNTEEKA